MVEFNGNFIDECIKSSGKNLLIQELSAIDQDTLKKQIFTGKEVDNYILGCTYKLGPFLTDSNRNIIYRNEYPRYFNFLKQYYNY